MASLKKCCLVQKVWLGDENHLSIMKPGMTCAPHTKLPTGLESRSRTSFTGSTIE